MADLGTYHFLPWLRRGIGAALAPAAGPLPARAQLKVVLGIDATLNGTVTPITLPSTTVNVLGPGDILGMLPFHVIRTEPRPYTSNFEPNYLAGIEFDTRLAVAGIGAVGVGLAGAGVGAISTAGGLAAGKR